MGVIRPKNVYENSVLICLVGEHCILSCVHPARNHFINRHDTIAQKCPYIWRCNYIVSLILVRKYATQSLTATLAILIALCWTGWFLTFIHLYLTQFHGVFRVSKVEKNITTHRPRRTFPKLFQVNALVLWNGFNMVIALHHVWVLGVNKIISITITQQYIVICNTNSRLKLFHYHDVVSFSDTVFTTSICIAHIRLLILYLANNFYLFTFDKINANKLNSLSIFQAFPQLSNKSIIETIAKRTIFVIYTRRNASYGLNGAKIHHPIGRWSRWNFHTIVTISVYCLIWGSIVWVYSGRFP